MVESLYVLARVDETDRGSLKTGLDADVEVQAVGSQPAPARITAFSALAKVEFGPIWPPPRLFDVQLDLVTPNPAMRPGMTAAIKIRRDKVPRSPARADAGALPADQPRVGGGGGSGTPAEVFVLGRRGFERRSVRVARRGPDKSAIADGLRAGREGRARAPRGDRRAMTRGKRIGWSIGGIVVVAALGLGARAATGVLVSASDDIPTGDGHARHVEGRPRHHRRDQGDEDRHPLGPADRRRRCGS